MKNITQSFKNNIKKYGRQINAIINVNNQVLTSEDINNINPSYNTVLFKTVMHVLEIDSNIKIPKGSNLNAKIGIKFDNSEYEYIEYNNYKIIDEPEKQEDTLSYRHFAYDKMVESMIDYDLNITNRITLREYLIRICQRLGWNTNNIPASFINSEKFVSPALHQGINYTFRDALDEIATISCSFLFFIGEDFYLKYVTETNEIIDEEYLSEDDVTIEDEYFINSLVFARAEGSDNIYRKDDTSIENYGLHEYRISDNQLLSTNDRVSYIDEMFNYLKTFRFYTYDVKSIGIMFFDVADRFTFNIHEQSYSGIALNDETNVTQGLQERLYADKPKETETNYKYADETDKKINQTNLNVDKQNQRIEALITQTADHEERMTQVEQDIDGIKEQVEKISEFDREVIGTNIIHLTDSSEIEDTLLELNVAGDMEYIYPSSTTYPSEQLYPIGQYINIIIDKNPRGNISDEAQRIHIDLQEPLRYLNQNVFDEIQIVDKNMKIIRRVGLSANGEKYELENAIETDLGEMHLKSFKEDTYIYVLESYVLSLKARYLIDNDYIETFATKVELSTSVSTTAEGIMTEVRKKVGEDEFALLVSQNAEAVKLAWNQISQYIQLEVINQKVCLAIRDKNDKLLMTLDEEGQHFYDKDEKIVETVAMPTSSFPTMFFNVDGDNVVNNQGIYNTALGFSVSMTSQDDGNKYYYPMFYWGRCDTSQHQGVHVREKLIFDDGDESASQSPFIDKNYGGLVFLVRDGSNIMVKTLNNKTVATIGQGTLTLLDENQNSIIELYKNSNNTYTLNMPTVSLFIDSLTLGNASNLIANYIEATTWIEAPHVEAQNVPDICNCSTISASNGTLHVCSRDGIEDLFFTADWTSDARLKKNIEISNKDSLELIKSIPHYAFDWKKDGKHEDIGYIAQELENIDKNLVNKHEITNEKDEVVDYDWTINDRYIIANLTRAVQQQQELIDYLYSQLKIKKVKTKKTKKEKYKKDFGEKCKINFKYEKEKMELKKIKEKLKRGNING